MKYTCMFFFVSTRKPEILIRAVSKTKQRETKLFYCSTVTIAEIYEIL